jgi:hypothetical protein
MNNILKSVLFSLIAALVLAIPALRMISLLTWIKSVLKHPKIKGVLMLRLQQSLVFRFPN